MEEVTTDEDELLLKGDVSSDDDDELNPNMLDDFVVIDELSNSYNSHKSVTVEEDHENEQISTESNQSSSEAKYPDECVNSVKLQLSTKPVDSQKTTKENLYVGEEILQCSKANDELNSSTAEETNTGVSMPKQQFIAVSEVDNFETSANITDKHCIINQTSECSVLASNPPCCNHTADLSNNEPLHKVSSNLIESHDVPPVNPTDTEISILKDSKTCVALYSSEEPLELKSIPQNSQTGRAKVNCSNSMHNDNQVVIKESITSPLASDDFHTLSTLTNSLEKMPKLTRCSELFKQPCTAEIQHGESVKSSACLNDPSTHEEPPKSTQCELSDSSVVAHNNHPSDHRPTSSVEIAQDSYNQSSVRHLTGHDEDSKVLDSASGCAKVVGLMRNNQQENSPSLALYTDISDDEDGVFTSNNLVIDEGTCPSKSDKVPKHQNTTADRDGGHFYILDRIAEQNTPLSQTLSEETFDNHKDENQTSQAKSILTETAEVMLGNVENRDSKVNLFRNCKLASYTDTNSLNLKTDHVITSVDESPMTQGGNRVNDKLVISDNNTAQLQHNNDSSGNGNNFAVPCCEKTSQRKSDENCLSIKNIENESSDCFQAVIEVLNEIKLKIIEQELDHVPNVSKECIVESESNVACIDKIKCPFTGRNIPVIDDSGRDNLPRHKISVCQSPNASDNLCQKDTDAISRANKIKKDVDFHVNYALSSAEKKHDEVARSEINVKTEKMSQNLDPVSNEIKGGCVQSEPYQQRNDLQFKETRVSPQKGDSEINPSENTQNVCESHSTLDCMKKTEKTQSDSISCSNEKKFNKITYKDLLYTCDLCQISAEKDEFVEHLVCHRTMKPFFCFVCKNSFSTRVDVLRHIKVDHPENKSNSCGLKGTKKVQEFMKIAQQCGQYEFSAYPIDKEKIKKMSRIYNRKRPQQNVSDQIASTSKSSSPAKMKLESPLVELAKVKQSASKEDSAALSVSVDSSSSEFSNTKAENLQCFNEAFNEDSTQQISQKESEEKPETLVQLNLQDKLSLNATDECLENPSVTLGTPTPSLISDKICEDGLLTVTDQDKTSVHSSAIQKSEKTTETIAPPVSTSPSVPVVTGQTASSKFTFSSIGVTPLVSSSALVSIGAKHVPDESKAAVTTAEATVPLVSISPPAPMVKGKPAASVFTSMSIGISPLTFSSSIASTRSKHEEEATVISGVAVQQPQPAISSVGICLEKPEHITSFAKATSADQTSTLPSSTVSLLQTSTLVPSSTPASASPPVTSFVGKHQTPCVTLLPKLPQPGIPSRFHYFPTPVALPRTSPVALGTFTSSEKCQQKTILTLSPQSTLPNASTFFAPGATNALSPGLKSPILIPLSPHLPAQSPTLSTTVVTLASPSQLSSQMPVSKTQHVDASSCLTSLVDLNVTPPKTIISQFPSFSVTTTSTVTKTLQGFVPLTPRQTFPKSGLGLSPISTNQVSPTQLTVISGNKQYFLVPLHSKPSNSDVQKRDSNLSGCPFSKGSTTTSVSKAKTESPSKSIPVFVHDTVDSVNHTVNMEWSYNSKTGKFFCVQCKQNFDCETDIRQHLWIHLHIRTQACKNSLSKITMKGDTDQSCPTVNLILSQLKQSADEGTTSSINKNTTEKHAQPSGNWPSSHVSESSKEMVDSTFNTLNASAKLKKITDVNSGAEHKTPKDSDNEMSLDISNDRKELGLKITSAFSLQDVHCPDIDPDEQTTVEKQHSGVKLNDSTHSASLAPMKLHSKKAKLSADETVVTVGEMNDQTCVSGEPPVNDEQNTINGHSKSEADEPTCSKSEIGAGLQIQHTNTISSTPNTFEVNAKETSSENGTFSKQSEIHKHFQTEQVPDTDRSSTPDLCSSENDGFYKCGVDKCEFQSLDGNLFKTHLQVDHKYTWNFPCSYCGFISNGDENYVRHLVSHTTKKRFLLFRCGVPSCRFGTNLIQEFRDHYKILHPKEQFTCSKCKESFPSLEELLSHLQTNKLKFIQCPYCCVKDTRRTSIIKHLNEKHAGKPKQISVSSELICKERHHYGYQKELWSITKQQVESRRRSNPDAPVTQTTKSPHVVDVTSHEDESLRFSMDVVGFSGTAENIQLTCIICGFLSKSLAELMDHLNVKECCSNASGNIFFRCRVCNYQSTRIRVITNHLFSTCNISRSNLLDNLSFYCKKCDFHTQKLNEVASHSHCIVLRNITDEPERSIQQQDINSSEQTDNIQKPLSIKESVNECKSNSILCKRSLPNEQSVSSATICNSSNVYNTATNASSIKSRKSSNKDSENFITTTKELTASGVELCCKQCSYQAFNAIHLQQHERVHTKGEKNDSFSCPECPEGSSSLLEMKKHISHHPGAHNISVFFCNHCSYSSNQYLYIFNHIQKHGNFNILDASNEYREQKVSISSKVQKCSECSYTSVNLENIIRHSFTNHENVNQLKCPGCAVDCESEEHLHKHMKENTSNCGERYTLYACKECAYTTTSISYIDTHLMSKLHAEYSTKEKYVLSNKEKRKPSFSSERLREFGGCADNKQIDEYAKRDESKKKTKATKKQINQLPNKKKCDSKKLKFHNIKFDQAKLNNLAEEKRKHQTKPNLSSVSEKASIKKNDCIVDESAIQCVVVDGLSHICIFSHSWLLDNLLTFGFLTVSQKLYKCNICGLHHKNATLICFHVSGHIRLRPHHCKYCGFMSLEYDKILKHCHMKHPESKACVVAKKITRDELKKCANTHSDRLCLPQVQIRECDSSTEVFDSNQCSEDDIKEWKCSDVLIQGIKKHQCITSDGNLKKYFLKKELFKEVSNSKIHCNHCNLVFKSWFDIVCHLCHHFQIKVHRCFYCTFESVEHWKIKSHIKLKHPNTPPRIINLPLKLNTIEENIKKFQKSNDLMCSTQYVCPVCDSEFANKLKLVCHLRVRHAITNIHFCGGSCRFVTLTEEKLLRHREKHNHFEDTNIKNSEVESFIPVASNYFPNKITRDLESSASCSLDVSNKGSKVSEFKSMQIFPLKKPTMKKRTPIKSAWCTPRMHSMDSSGIPSPTSDIVNLSVHHSINGEKSTEDSDSSGHMDSVHDNSKKMHHRLLPVDTGGCRESTLFQERKKNQNDDQPLCEQKSDNAPNDSSSKVSKKVHKNPSSDTRLLSDAKSENKVYNSNKLNKSKSSVDTHNIVNIKQNVSFLSPVDSLVTEVETNKETSAPNADKNELESKTSRSTSNSTCSVQSENVVESLSSDGLALKSDKNKIPSQWKCKICSSVLSTIKLLDNHIQTVHPQYGLLCKICKTVRSSVATVYKHHLKHHQNATVSFKPVKIKPVEKQTNKDSQSKEFTNQLQNKTKENRSNQEREAQPCTLAFVNTIEESISGCEKITSFPDTGTDTIAKSIGTAEKPAHTSVNTNTDGERLLIDSIGKKTLESVDKNENSTPSDEKNSSQSHKTFDLTKKSITTNLSHSASSDSTKISVLKPNPINSSSGHSMDCSQATSTEIDSSSITKFCEISNPQQHSSHSIAQTKPKKAKPNLLRNVVRQSQSHHISKGSEQKSSGDGKLKSMKKTKNLQLNSSMLANSVPVAETLNHSKTETKQATEKQLLIVKTEEPMCSSTKKNKIDVPTNIDQQTRERVYMMCELCGMSYHGKHIKYHINTHFNYKPYVCKHCDLRFPLRRDVRIHHEKRHSDLEMSVSEERDMNLEKTMASYKKPFSKPSTPAVQSAMLSGEIKRSPSTKMKKIATEKKSPKDTSETKMQLKERYRASSESNLKGKNKFPVLSPRKSNSVIKQPHTDEKKTNQDVQRHIKAETISRAEIESPTGHDAKRAKGAFLEIGSDIFGCRKCSFTSSSKPTIMAHFRQIHRDDCFKCLHCSFIGINRTNVKIHVRKKHPEVVQETSLLEEKPKKRKLADDNISVCSNISLESTATSEHSYTSESSVKRKDANYFLCHLCPYKFHGLFHFRKHLANDHKGKFKHLSCALNISKCSYCDFTTYDMQELALHHRNHITDRPFKCGYCEFSAFQRAHLKYHQKNIHKELPFNILDENYSAHNVHPRENNSNFSLYLVDFDPFVVLKDIIKKRKKMKDGNSPPSKKRKL